MGDIRETTTAVNGNLVVRATEVTGTRLPPANVSDRLKYITTIVQTAEGDKELCVKVTGLGGGGGGGGSFDPTDIEGYDATKLQYLLNDKGTLKFAELSENKIYTGFNSTNYILAAGACPSSYTKAQAFIHIKGSPRREGAAGQVLLSTTNDNGNIGFTNEQDLIELYNGSTSILGTFGMAGGKHDYWLRCEVDGISNEATLYYLYEQNYTYGTLPTNLSEWNIGCSISNYTWASKQLQIGRPNSRYAPSYSTFYDVKLLFDGSVFLDLQNENTFNVQGGLTVLQEYSLVSL